MVKWHHLSLSEDQKEYTAARMKTLHFRPYSKSETAQRKEQGLPTTVPSFEILFEGSFERAKPSWWGYSHDWDEVCVSNVVTVSTFWTLFFLLHFEYGYSSRSKL